MNKPLGSGNRLRVFRADKRLSQYRTAKKARISHNRYWRIELEYTEPTPDECVRLAKALGAPDVTAVFPHFVAEAVA